MAKLAVRASAGGAATFGFGEEVEQRGVLFVDAHERAFDFGEGLVEDALRMRCCSSAKSEVRE